MALVTLQQAIDHLVLPIDPDAVPPDPRLPDLKLKLAAAEGIILDYLKTPDPAWTDETNTPPTIQACILWQLGEFWRFRGDDSPVTNAHHGGAVDPTTQGQLSPMLTNLLRRYRDPALA